MRLLFLALLSALVAIAADTYNGKWTSDQSGNGGGITITLKPEPKVVFTMSGEEVACTIASSKVESDSIDIAYDFTVQGYKLRSTLKGTAKDGKVEGKYTTKSVDDGTAVDSGTFQGTAN